jgi:hypothetical protein
MRPRAIQSVPGLHPNSRPFERLKSSRASLFEFPRYVADKTIEKPVPEDREACLRKSEGGIEAHD